MSDSKIVSVLICTHNAERFISSTLFSVFKQTYHKIEILIHDDASNDNTIKLITDLKPASPFPITIFKSNKNIGPYKGLNRLLSKASGKYIAILDHDDLWHKDKLELQIAFLESHKKYLACGAMIHVLWEEYNKISTFSVKKLDNKTYHNTLVFVNNKSFRYREDFVYRNDFYFMKNCVCRHGNPIYNLQTPLAIWRIQAGKNNLSKRWAGLKSISRYCYATLDIFGAILALGVHILPAKIVFHLLLYRHASHVFDYKPDLLDDLLNLSHEQVFEKFLVHPV